MKCRRKLGTGLKVIDRLDDYCSRKCSQSGYTIHSFSSIIHINCHHYDILPNVNAFVAPIHPRMIDEFWQIFCYGLIFIVSHCFFAMHAQHTVRLGVTIALKRSKKAWKWRKSQPANTLYAIDIIQLKHMDAIVALTDCHVHMSFDWIIRSLFYSEADLRFPIKTLQFLLEQNILYH